jgi:hypothetical protein
MLYGRSLSLCISDIIRGNKVKESDVEMLVTSTAFDTEESFQRGIKIYSETYWSNDPALGIEIANRLWNSGKIFQPRLLDRSMSQDLRQMKIWVNTLEECTYYPND